MMTEQESTPVEARADERATAAAAKPTGSAVTPYIVPLRRLEATNPNVAGAKAANLARLANAGFPVPSGVVVTTATFMSYVGNLPAVYPPALREAILSTPLAPDLMDELTAALGELSEGPVAVRSSGVAEDLEGASFAGQYDTFLGLETPQEVEEAIRKCWASAYGERVRAYQVERGAPTAPMAVLVQTLVAADSAGVAFTANPVSGALDETVVSAVRGLGERLVSGEASPDEWYVRDGKATAKSTPEGAIDAAQAAQVAALARAVEAHFGPPQDVEWAIAGEELYLLQARPITTLEQEQPAEKPMIAVPVHIPEGHWEREESHYPDPLSPATRSTFVPAVNRAMRHMCSELSLFIEALEQREIGGWLYQRVVPLGGKDLPTPPAWLVPLLIRIVPPLRKRIAGAVQVAREDKAAHILDRWTHDWKPELLAERDRLAAVALPALGDSGLAAHVEEVRGYTEVCIERHMMLNGAIQLILAEYAFACRDLLGWDAAKMMLAFSGLSEASSAPARSLAELARQAHDDVELLDRLSAGAPLAELRGSHPEFVELFDRHVAEFGCRALRHELAFPTVGESPELLLRLLRDQIQHRYDPADDDRRLQQQRHEQLAEAQRLLADQPEAARARFRQALERAEKAYPIREEHGHYDRDTPVALLRYALLEIGRRLTARHDIEQVDDVFFLEYTEALAALDGTLAAPEELVARRKAELNWVLANPGAASYGPRPPAPPSMAAFPKEARESAEGVLWSLEQVFATAQSGRVQHDAEHIEGIPASSGRYTGKVRIVRDESEFDRIQPGDVLVCPITSPVWSMLFPSIGALVTDSGGILSHSAIIAREYRIPGVVATGNATELLRDGQLVTVDGSAGLVQGVCT